MNLLAPARAAALAAGLLLALPAATAQTPQADQTISTLPNGLQIVVIPDPRTTVVTHMI